MNTTLFMCLVLLCLISCKKENNSPTLSFTAADKQWFIYELGNKIQFVTVNGDSLNYKVIYVDSGYLPQYVDLQPNSPILGMTEFYYATLAAKSDSIFIYFYKQFGGSNLEKMKQTIRWNTFKSQFAELEAIENGSPLTTKNVNGILYSNVTTSSPVGTLTYSFTRFNQAYYDQKYGFIEILDTANVVWSRIKL